MPSSSNLNSLLATTIRYQLSKINEIALLGNDFTGSYTWRLNPYNTVITPNNESQFPIVDVTGMSAKIQIKILPTDAAALKEYTELSGITLDGANKPNIIWNVPVADINTLGVGVFVYDILMTDTLGKLTTIAGGNFTIEQNVTN